MNLGVGWRVFFSEADLEKKVILAFKFTFNNLQTVDKDFCMLGAGEYGRKSDNSSCTTTPQPKNSQSREGDRI